MNKKITLFFIGIIFIGLYIFSGRNKDNNFNKILSDIGLKETIRATHHFENGTHALAGEINLPTLCHIDITSRNRILTSKISITMV